METDPHLLIVEDDASFARALGRSFERRGYQGRLFEQIDDIKRLLEDFSPHYAVIDLKLASSSGLECIKMLHQRDPDMKIVVLTGFASIATAVEAIKHLDTFKPRTAGELEIDHRIMRREVLKK